MIHTIHCRPGRFPERRFFYRMGQRAPVPCEEVARQLWAYIDGELTPELSESVRAHLEDCARCFPRYDFHRAFLAFLRKHPEQPVPPGIRRKVWEQILREHERGG